jgi:hypothetical protein
MLNAKQNGFYVEIGGHDGYAISNTSLLEGDFEWGGIALDISKKCVNRYNRKRRNKCLLADATNFNYEEELLKINAPYQIDYLQVDIEPARQSLAALKILPLRTRRFSVITFEHDVYASEENLEVQVESRQILESHGYELVVKNVMSHGNPYEDWWVDPKMVSRKLIREFKNENIEDYAIFKDCQFV